jgi:hypothetical protein
MANETTRTIVKVNPDSYGVILDPELDALILDALDKHGREGIAKNTGIAATTTLVALMISQAAVERDKGEGFVADGVVVPVRRVGNRLRTLEGHGKVRAVKPSGQRELRWWHIDHLHTWTLRQAERRNEVEQRNERSRLVRERWEALGFPARDVDVLAEEIVFTFEVAEEMAQVIEETLKLVNWSRQERGEEPV